MQFAQSRSLFAAFAVILLFCNNAFSQTSYTWNGSFSEDWNLPVNWTPAGVPAATDNVTIDATGANQPAMHTSGSVANLFMSGGTLQLNGFSLAVTGATATFSGGAIVNGTINLTVPGTAIFSGTTFGAAVEGSAAGLLFNGSTFNSIVSLTKTGSTADHSTGNNTFNGITSISNSGSNLIRLANNTRDIFNNDVTFTNTGTNLIDVARQGATGTLFNGNIIVNSISGTGISFGQGSGLAVLAAGKTIAIGSLGFTAGTLALRNFVQQGSEALQLTLSGSSTLSLQAGSVFNGSFTGISPSVALNGATFNGITTIEKTGSVLNTFLGGNTFNGTTIIINSGTNYIRLSNSNRDIFNGDVTFTNTGSSYIDVARHDIGGISTEFNGNVFVNSISGTGIHFCQGNGTAVLGAGKTISAGNLGFSSGTLTLTSFTQLGSTPQNLILGGTALLSFQPGSTFQAPVTAAAHGIIVTGTTFHAPASFHKTGAGTNNGAGGNTFNSTATFTMSGTGVLNLNNTGTDIFKEDIIVNASAGSIRFGQSTGSSTLAAGKTIRIGSNGFTGGTLMLQRFRQLGTAPINLNMTGTISFQAGTVIEGNLSVVATGITLDGATFNGSAAFVKTGASSTSAGGNTFNGVTSFTNNGSSYLRLANVNRDVFNADVTFSNSATGTSYIDVARNDASGTQFNGNVYVNNSSGTGILICPSAGNGTATLAPGKTISVGTIGFTAGGLYLRNLTQLGTTPQTITLAGTASQLHLLAGTVFNGSFTSVSPSLFLNGATFNGITSLTKTGSSANTSTGGCTFNGPVTITNSGTGNMTLANSTSDDFNAAAHFVQRNRGLLQPAFNTASTFAGDISTVGTTTAINFANGASGRVVIDGDITQVFRGEAAFQPQVQRLTMATSGTGSLQLQVNLQVVQELAFSSGVVEATTAGADTDGLLVLQNGISFTEDPHNNSHVSGYVRKIGDSAFIFPTGNGSAYRPIAITAPAAATDHFTAAYFQADPDTEYARASREGELNYVSHLEHWMLEQTEGVSDVQVQLWWQEQSNITDVLSLLVARWNGSSWISKGNGGITQNGKAGTIKSEVAMNAFGPFTFGSVYTSFESTPYAVQGTLPIELMSFTAAVRSKEIHLTWRTACEIDNDYFTVERSADGMQFESVTTVKGNGTTSTVSQYTASDLHPLPGTSYYRLKQTDFDGKFTYSNVLAVKSNSSQKQEISIFPNPSTGAAVSVALPEGLKQQLIITVADLRGSVVYSSAIPVPASGHVLKIEPFQPLKPGVYLVTVRSGTSTFSRRLVVQ